MKIQLSGAFLGLVLILVSCNFNKQTPLQTGFSNPENQGPCEGCEAIFETPIPFEKLPSAITLPGIGKEGEKISISGTVFLSDGKTPAEGVVMYVYHTDQSGIYPKKGNESGWGKKHGYIRGWLKTGKKGNYLINTLIPASYPNTQVPQHIHIFIKETLKPPYWINDFLFDGDPHLNAEERKKAIDKSGNAVLKPILNKGILKAYRNIQLVD